MTLAALTFESPSGALVALSVLLPIVAAIAVARRSVRVAEVLRLPPARRRTARIPLAVAITACALLTVAAARPVDSEGGDQLVRRDSQIVFVVDISRSMLAAPEAGGESRLARAKAVVQTLREAVPRVPAGIAGLTDRVLPFTFPTTDPAIFTDTLRRSVVIDNPPPRDVATVATTFAALRPLDRDGFFDPGITRRTCVVVTDGETRAYAPRLGGAGRARRCTFLAIRIGSRTDRVWGEGGRPEIEYRADPAAPQNVARLATARGGRAWSAADLGGAVDALRAAADAGPTDRVRTAPESRSLAPFFAAGALLLAAGLALTALRGAGLLSRLSLRSPPSAP